MNKEILVKFVIFVLKQRDLSYKKIIKFLKLILTEQRYYKLKINRLIKEFDEKAFIDEINEILKFCNVKVDKKQEQKNNNENKEESREAYKNEIQKIFEKAKLLGIDPKQIAKFINIDKHTTIELINFMFDIFLKDNKYFSNATFYFVKSFWDRRKTQSTDININNTNNKNLKQLTQPYKKNKKDEEKEDLVDKEEVLNFIKNFTKNNLKNL